MICLYILEIKLLLVVIICRYFLLVHSLSFHFVMVSFVVQKLVGLIRSHLFVFTFIPIALED